MSVTVYRSTDAEAPQLTGEAGTLIAVLDACLVNGYGSQAAAGWTKAFSGTNTATYRQGVGSNQYYLHVRDDAPNATALGREAWVFGSEIASAVLTGANIFPTAAQYANNSLFIRKSVDVGATTRTWVLVGDIRTFYMFVLTADVGGAYFAWMFGEFYSFKDNYSYHTMLIARGAGNLISASTQSSVDQFDGMTYNFTNCVGHYMSRDGIGSVSSTLLSKKGQVGLTTAGASYPMCGEIVGGTNLYDHRIILSPILISTSVPVKTVLGRMRGLWHYCHTATSVSDGDILYGTGDLAGRTFLMLKSLTLGGVACVEISNTWDTNE